jgi:16S rRNA (cytosine967-C5)-methyltransferase
MGARETALNALIACRKNGAWSNGVLKEYVQRDRLDRREAALAARLCYGVLQNRGKLDFYLKQLLTGRLKDLHPAVHDILHLGLYQLYEMDKIPQSAAVNESVLLAKNYCRKLRNAPGLVNAVLRNAIRSAGTLKQPTALCDLYSHPQELISLLKQYVGKQRLEPMLQANNAVPPTVVQCNTKRTDLAGLQKILETDGVGVQPHPWLENCLVLTDSFGLSFVPFLTGNYKQVHYYDPRYYDEAAVGHTVAEMIEKYDIRDIYVVVGGLHCFESSFLITKANKQLYGE